MRYSQVPRTCLFCGASFTIKKSHAEKGKGVFCSMTCKGAHKTRETQRAHEDRFGLPFYDVLYLLYHKRKMSISEIASELKTSTRTIYDWITDLNFPVRGRSDAVALQWKDNPARRAQASASMRAAPRPTGDANPAKRADVRAKISAGKTGKPVPKLQGSGNPRWRGGKVDYRGPDWKAQKGKALIRDNHCCADCGSTQQLEVHHKVPFRISQDNQLSNLITLCVICHNRAETLWERQHPVQQPRLKLF